jgi:hypothetical protein
MRIVVLPLVCGVLVACAQPDVASVNAAPAPSPKPRCSAPPPVRDIWALAPMLKRDGKLSDEMSREQQEQVIRDYIRLTNQQYLNCTKQP